MPYMAAVGVHHEEQQQLDALLASPIGPQLTTVRAFLVDRYRLWHTAEGQRRALEEAQARCPEQHRGAAAGPASAHLPGDPAVDPAGAAHLMFLNHLIPSSYSSSFLLKPIWRASSNANST